MSGLFTKTIYNPYQNKEQRNIPAITLEEYDNMWRYLENKKEKQEKRKN